LKEPEWSSADKDKLEGDNKIKKEKNNEGV